MKAVVKYESGVGNVGLRDMPEPMAGPGQVKIEVRAAGVCGTDLHIYADEYKTTPPIILGHELSGVVAEVGEGVTRCKVGDRVTSETYFDTCGVCRYCRGGRPNLCNKRRSIGSIVNGAMTRYVIVPQVNVHILPDHIDFRAAALTEPLACVVHGGLLHTRVMPGDVVLVSGPGTIGQLAAQVAKAAQATVVVSGLSQDEHRLELARELGADVTVNVEKQDLFKVLADMTDGYGADIVFECAGAGAAAAMCLKAVRKAGQYCQMGIPGKPIQWDMDMLLYKEVAVSTMFATIPEAWTKALDLMAKGLVNTGPLASHLLPVTEWERAFQMFRDKVGYKIMLEPVE